MIIRKLICFIFLFIIMASGFVYAENKNKNTDASIRFTADTGPTSPVNPDDPKIPDTELPVVTGDLVILFISYFNFETGVISTKKKFYDIDATKKPNIQIVDLRGKGAGWSLDARVSGFKNELGQQSLNGSVIHITNGSLISETSMDFAPTVHTDVELSTDNSPARIITANKGKGQGLWVNRLYPENTGSDAYVKLEVPAGAASLETHTATIEWTLSNTP